MTPLAKLCCGIRPRPGKRGPQADAIGIVRLMALCTDAGLPINIVRTRHGQVVLGQGYRGFIDMAVVAQCRTLVVGQSQITLPGCMLVRIMAGGTRHISASTCTLSLCIKQRQRAKSATLQTGTDIGYPLGGSGHNADIRYRTVDRMRELPNGFDMRYPLVVMA